MALEGRERLPMKMVDDVNSKHTGTGGRMVARRRSVVGAAESM